MRKTLRKLYYKNLNIKFVIVKNDINISENFVINYDVYKFF